MVFGILWPDQTSPNARSASPKDAFLIEAFTANINTLAVQTAWYNTWTSAKLQQYNSSATSASDKDKLLKEALADHQAYLANHRVDLSKRYWFHLSRTLCHEMGHGMGLDDLNPPSDGGPWSCVMRYISYTDFAPDQNDRFEIARRWTSALKPTVFCHDATATKRNLACYAQIQVTDRESGGLVAPAGSIPLPARTSPASTPLGQAGNNANPFLSVLRTNLSALAATAELEWMPVLAGDPLRLTVTLNAPNWLQTMDQAV